MWIKPLCVRVLFPMGSRELDAQIWALWRHFGHMGCMLDSDWLKKFLLRCDWLVPLVASITTLEPLGLEITKGLFIWARLTGMARLPGWISPWVHMRKFSPVSEMRKGQRSWGRVLAPNLGNKANMDKHKIFYFRASVTLKAVSLQLNGMLMMCKIQQAMQDDAIRTTRIHPAVHPGNWDEVFIWQNFQPAYRHLGWKNRDLGNRASPPTHMNTSQILRRI